MFSLSSAIAQSDCKEETVRVCDQNNSCTEERREVCRDDSFDDLGRNCTVRTECETQFNRDSNSYERVCWNECQ